MQGVCQCLPIIPEFQVRFFRFWWNGQTAWRFGIVQVFVSEVVSVNCCIAWFFAPDTWRGCAGLMKSANQMLSIYCRSLAGSTYGIFEAACGAGFVQSIGLTLLKLLNMCSRHGVLQGVSSWVHFQATLDWPWLTTRVAQYFGLRPTGQTIYMDMFIKLCFACMTQLKTSNLDAGFWNVSKHKENLHGK